MSLFYKCPFCDFDAYNWASYKFCYCCAFGNNTFAMFIDLFDMGLLCKENANEKKIQEESFTVEKE